MKRLVLISIIAAALLWIPIFVFAAVGTSAEPHPVIQRTETETHFTMTRAKTEITYCHSPTLAGVYFGEKLQVVQNQFNAHGDVVAIASGQIVVPVDYTADQVQMAMTDSDAVFVNTTGMIIVKMTENEVDKITAFIYTTGSEGQILQASEDTQVRGPTFNELICATAMHDPEEWIPYHLSTEVQKDIADIKQGEVIQVLKTPTDVAKAYWVQLQPEMTSWMSGLSPPQYQRTEDMTGGVDDVVFVP